MYPCNGGYPKTDKNYGTIAYNEVFLNEMIEYVKCASNGIDSVNYSYTVSG